MINKTLPESDIQKILGLLNECLIEDTASIAENGERIKITLCETHPSNRRTLSGYLGNDYNGFFLRYSNRRWMNVKPHTRFNPHDIIRIERANKSAMGIGPFWQKAA